MDKEDLIRLGARERLKGACGMAKQLEKFISYFTFSPKDLTEMQVTAEAVIEAVKDYSTYFKEFKNG